MGTYCAVVVEDRTVIAKLRMLRSCMIRFSNIQGVGIEDGLSNYSKDMF